jgi:hypothetical protein
VTSKRCRKAFGGNWGFDLPLATVRDALRGRCVKGFLARENNPSLPGHISVDLDVNLPKLFPFRTLDWPHFLQLKYNRSTSPPNH